MSHVSSYQTTIVFSHVRGGGDLQDDPAWAVLEEAVASCAESHGGRVGRSVADVFGRATPCDVAVVVPEFRSGIGMRVDRGTGELRFLYDAYGQQPETVNSLTDEIVQNFTSIAVARALRSLNYQVDVAEHGAGPERRVVVRGVL